MNKKSRLLLVVMLLCSITMQLYGQTHTVKNSFKHKFTCELIDDIEVNYTAYYDYDDNEIYHGPFAAKYSIECSCHGISQNRFSAQYKCKLNQIIAAAIENRDLPASVS